MRHNNVTLYGQVMKKPRIQKDEDGNYLKGSCTITVVRGIRDVGDNSLTNFRYDCPVIMTGNQDWISEMDTWDENDMVYIKGAVTTKNVKKSTICKECGQKNSAQGTIVFVNPIYCERREHGITKEQGLELLKSKAEISNEVTLVGTLCREPEAYKSPNGPLITQYQLAVNRKYKVKEDPPEVRTDYPWIKSYGEIASSDKKFLMTGSTVLIDGILQTREIKRTTMCENPECNKEYEWKDAAMEIIPYSVEYMQGFKLPEDIEKEEEDAQQQAIDQVFKKNDKEAVAS